MVVVAEFTRRGRNVSAPLSRDGKRIRLKSPTWWGRWRDEYGRLRAKGLSRDKAAAGVMLADLVRQVELRRAGVAPPPDPFSVHRERPLTGHLDDYERFLRAKGVTENHVTQTMTRARAADAAHRRAARRRPRQPPGPDRRGAVGPGDRGGRVGETVPRARRPEPRRPVPGRDGHRLPRPGAEDDHGGGDEPGVRPADGHGVAGLHQERPGRRAADHRRAGLGAGGARPGRPSSSPPSPRRRRPAASAPRCSTSRPATGRRRPPSPAAGTATSRRWRPTRRCR